MVQCTAIKQVWLWFQVNIKLNFERSENLTWCCVASLLIIVTSVSGGRVCVRVLLLPSLFCGDRIAVSTVLLPPPPTSPPPLALPVHCLECSFVDPSFSLFPYQ